MIDDYRKRLYDNYVGTHLQGGHAERLMSRAPYLRHLIRCHFPDDHSIKILDLGCGHGAMVHFAHQVGYKNMEGVDVSPEQVEEAVRIGIKGVRQGDLMEVLRGLAGESLGMVVAFDVVEHLTKKELFSLPR